ncbi:MAG: hypothetical protein ACE145_17130 [Terriglobia bacterium]
MNLNQMARDLHELWERAHSVHLQMSEYLATRALRDPWRRLALELAVHDVMALAARAEALASFAETPPPRRSRRGKPIA